MQLCITKSTPSPASQDLPQGGEKALNIINSCINLYLNLIIVFEVPSENFGKNPVALHIKNEVY